MQRRSLTRLEEALRQEDVDAVEGTESEDEEERSPGTRTGRVKGKSRRKACVRPEGVDQRRQAFSKRKRGLVLKVYQLYKLTDAKVFVFIVNDKGTSWAYASPGFRRATSQEHLRQMRDYAGVTGAQRLSTEIIDHPSKDPEDRRADEHCMRPGRGDDTDPTEDGDLSQANRAAAVHAPAADPGARIPPAAAPPSATAMPPPPISCHAAAAAAPAPSATAVPTPSIPGSAAAAAAAVQDPTVAPTPSALGCTAAAAAALDPVAAAAALALSRGGPVAAPEGDQRQLLLAIAAAAATAGLLPPVAAAAASPAAAELPPQPPPLFPPPPPAGPRAVPLQRAHTQPQLQTRLACDGSAPRRRPSDDGPRTLHLARAPAQVQLPALQLPLPSHQQLRPPRVASAAGATGPWPGWEPAAETPAPRDTVMQEQEQEQGQAPGAEGEVEEPPETSRPEAMEYDQDDCEVILCEDGRLYRVIRELPYNQQNARSGPRLGTAPQRPPAQWPER